MSFPLNQATIGPVFDGTAFDGSVFDGPVVEGTLLDGTVLAGTAPTGLVVTAVPAVHSIRYVPSRTAKMLTKRRAVDFCRVATAMCRRPLPFVA